MRVRTGFSLIEAAIVLGIAGLVIAGIWLAATSVSDNLKTSSLITGLMAITRNTQLTFSRNDAQSLGNNVDITSALINASAFPSDWVSGNTVKHPFAGGLNVSNWTSTGTPLFGIYMNGISAQTCIKFRHGYLLSLPCQETVQTQHLIAIPRLNKLRLDMAEEAGFISFHESPNLR